MNARPPHHGYALAGILVMIRQAEALALHHDRSGSGCNFHAEAAQRADELAEAGRRAARALIEQAFPGVSWSMIEAAAL